MTKEMELINELLEGKIPNVPGVKLELKKSGKEDDHCLYFDLPLRKDEEFCIVHWGKERRAAALYREPEFDKLTGLLQGMANSGGPVRRYVRMLMLTSRMGCRRKKLGFCFDTILLDETLGQWEYVEVPEEELTLNRKDPAYPRPFAFVTARDRITFFA